MNADKAKEFKGIDLRSSAAEMLCFMKDRGPELLSEILSRLFAARGWGRRQDRLHLERAWAEAAGPALAEDTRVAGLRRGVLEVQVGNSALLQELAQFHKRRLLEELRRRLPGARLDDLRFRAGGWGRPET
jgi:predicted nucleic acid-binding Zn ribbon protein